MFRWRMTTMPMAVWRVEREGNVAKLDYLNMVHRRAYPCGEVINAPWWMLLEAIVDRLSPSFGSDFFADGGQVWTFMAKPKERS